MKRTLLILCSLFFVAISNAQIENVILTLHLKNGDIISGKTDIREIAFKTDYGNLKLPVSDINSINIGLQNSDFDKSRLLDLLEKLDFGTENEKQSAFEEILKMKEGAIPFIKSYIGNAKEIPSKNDITVHVLFEVMLAKYKIKSNYKLYDEIFHNGKSTMVGTWTFKDLLLETAYGRIRIERDKIESIEIKSMTAQGFEKENTFKVFANKYITGNEEDAWLNTGILVKKGEKIIINSEGEVVLVSISGNKYSPDGGINGAPGPEGKKIVYGNLVFKIGQKDQAKKAGISLEQIAEKTGIIYLSIHETVFNIANSGYYNTNVKVK